MLAVLLEKQQSEMHRNNEISREQHLWLLAAATETFIIVLAPDKYE